MYKLLILMNIQPPATGNAATRKEALTRPASVANTQQRPAGVATGNGAGTQQQKPSVGSAKTPLVKQEAASNSRKGLPAYIPSIPQGGAKQQEAVAKTQPAPTNNQRQGASTAAAPPPSAVKKEDKKLPPPPPGKLPLPPPPPTPAQVKAAAPVVPFSASTKGR